MPREHQDLLNTRGLALSLIRAAALLLCVLAGCVAPTPGIPAPQLLLIPYSAGVTGLQPGPCTLRDGGALPDPVCTPGAVGSTDPTIVCTPGFQESHRVDVSRYRVRAMQAYNISAAETGTIEYDHLVPLSLGGANATVNLWPQRSDLPGEGVRNSKDTVETVLWRAVCVRHTVALADAQQAFTADWRIALSRLHVVVTSSFVF